MQNSSQERKGQWTALFVLVAAVGVVAAYQGAVAGGLRYDDYHFVRPWPSLDLRRVWYGSWDPTGVEPVFFRPLAAWMFAARFWLFGVNAQAMHIVSLLGHAVCAVLVGSLLRREGTSNGVCCLAVWTYAVYPVFAYSQVSWLTNQMHLLESVVVLAALLYWQSVRCQSLARWTVVAALAVVAFLIKEDAVMLPFVVVALTGLHAVRCGAAAWGRIVALSGIAVVLGVALVAFRFLRLHTLGGYGIPTPDVAAMNLVKGLERALVLWPTRHPWQGVASCIVILALVIALGFARHRVRHWPVLLVGTAEMLALVWTVPALSLPRSYPLFAVEALAAGVAASLLSAGICAAVWRRDLAALYLIGAGLAVSFGFDLPFVLVSKREQYHLIGLGGVIALAGASQAVWCSFTSARARWLCFAALALSTLPFLFSARSLASNFLPCSSEVLSTDQEARSWWVVPDEIREWLDLKKQRCAERTSPGELTELPVVVWGAYNVGDRESGGVDRWISDRSVVLLRRGTTTIRLGFRRSDASASHPVFITISTSEKSVPMKLVSGEWHYATIRVRPNVLSWLRSDERLDVAVESWFVPAILNPESQDLRRLGAEFRILDLQPTSANAATD